MLELAHELALRAIYNRIENNNILWALTGSTSFTVQGMKLNPSDIDIQSNQAGAYKINELLKEFEVKPVSFSSTELIRSYFGSFIIHNVSIEVMGDIQKNVTVCGKK